MFFSGGFLFLERGLRYVSGVLPIFFPFSNESNEGKFAVMSTMQIPFCVEKLEGHKDFVSILCAIFQLCLSDQHWKFASQDKSVMNLKCPGLWLVSIILTKLRNCRTGVNLDLN